MVVPWIGYIIWKNWVIHVLVFLVFHVFSTVELISPCKTVNLAVWAFSSFFLHDFTLFGIDMNYIYHISSIATTFGPLSKVTILGQKCMAILGIRLVKGTCYFERPGKVWGSRASKTPRAPRIHKPHSKGSLVTQCELSHQTSRWLSLWHPLMISHNSIF